MILNKRGKGFTLIELMIVVTIIGLLAAVATPKFANMLKKAKQAASKNALGVLRSVAGIYYADHQGTFAYEETDVASDSSGDATFSFISDLDSIGNNAFTPTYVSAIPNFKSGIQSYPFENNNNVIISEDGGTFDYDTRVANYTYAAAWVYFKRTGMWYINCDYEDTTGVIISTW